MKMADGCRRLYEATVCLSKKETNASWLAAAALLQSQSPDGRSRWPTPRHRAAAGSDWLELAEKPHGGRRGQMRSS